MILTNEQKQTAMALYRSIQKQLWDAFERIDGEAKITPSSWQREPEGQGGGGTMGVLRGKVIEKAGANFSEVYGNYPAIEHEHSGKPFFASGVSTITHMYNPYAPIGHMNVRIIDVGDTFWIGGGGDLTPFMKFDEDTALFHEQMKSACALLGDDAYDKYAKWCDEYFYIKHRKSVRGVGGIFFDYLKIDFDKAMEFQKQVGEGYVQAYSAIIDKRKNTAFTEEEKDGQLYWRGRYAEYNLVYDRGTKFGLQTDGHIEAIFVSLPPVVKW